MSFLAPGSLFLVVIPNGFVSCYLHNNFQNQKCRKYYCVKFNSLLEIIIHLTEPSTDSRSSWSSAGITEGEGVLLSGEIVFYYRIF